MVHLSETRFRLVFIEVFIFSTKNMDSLTLKRHNSFQNQNNRKAMDSFTPRPLIFKSWQEVWKFNDIGMSWSSPKYNMETNFLNL